MHPHNFTLPRITTPVERPATEQERELADSIAKFLFEEHFIHGQDRPILYAMLVNHLRARPEPTCNSPEATPARETTAEVQPDSNTQAAPELIDNVLLEGFKNQVSASTAALFAVTRLRDENASLKRELAAMKAKADPLDFGQSMLVEKARDPVGRGEA